MTIFGVDGSNNTPNFPVADLPRQGYDFLSWKLTEGTGFHDLTFDATRAQAEKAGLLFAAFHVLHGKTDAAGVAEADFACSHLADKSIPLMLDFEPLDGGQPRKPAARAFVRRCKTHGVRVTLDYLPNWYWLPLRFGLLNLPRLVSSAYPSSAHQHGAALYPGDKGEGWKRYGGRTPVIWQFASTALIDGYQGNVDVNAFRGTRAQLAALGVFKDYAPTPTPKPPKPPTPEPAPSEPLIVNARVNLRAALKQHPANGPVHRAVQKALDDLKGI